MLKIIKMVWLVILYIGEFIKVNFVLFLLLILFIVLFINSNYKNIKGRSMMDVFCLLVKYLISLILNEI